MGAPTYRAGTPHPALAGMHDAAAVTEFTADHAHPAREFRSLAGRTPSAYRDGR